MLDHYQEELQDSEQLKHLENFTNKMLGFQKLSFQKNDAYTVRTWCGSRPVWSRFVNWIGNSLPFDYPCY